jgi:mannosyl-3-phosphoglycerate phosphatase
MRTVVVSDLDGTLLDHETYAFDAAWPALDCLERDAIPLVLCSSKTRAEIEPLRAELRNGHPFISENGGALFIPDGYFAFDIDGAERRDAYLVVRLGDAYADLVTALAAAACASGVRVRGFADMTDADVASATGLTIDQARLARRREFDEPFEVLDPDGEASLTAEIARRGKRWTTGGRFHHIVGRNDKAEAVRLLASLYRRAFGAVRTIGLGDAPNDAGFLAEVDVPIVIPSARAAELQTLVPEARVATRRGPAGWSDEVLAAIGATG